VVPGDDLPHVLTGTLLRQILAGDLPRDEELRFPIWQRVAFRMLGGSLQRTISPGRIRWLSRWWMPLAERVVVIGGDLAAVELSEFLAERGRRVAIVESGEEIAPEVGLKRRTEHMDRLDRLAVAVHTGVRVDRIGREGVFLQGRGTAGVLIPGGSVIVAGDVEAETTLYDAIRERVPEAHAIGDCTGLGLIRKAVEEGARVGSTL
jgi:2,4-dienoyl-CoA reductase (NADPH2)